MAEESIHDILDRISSRLGVNISDVEGEAEKHVTLYASDTVTPQLTPKDDTDFVQAEAFLENSGFFTPSSKRIKHIYTKEKRIKEVVRPDGTKETLKVKIIASHDLGLPITSDLDYYRAFLKILDETVERDGRIRLPIAVPSSKLIRYAGKNESVIVWREVQDWFKRMTVTGIQGAVYLARQKDFDRGFIGTLFSQVVFRGDRLKSGKAADTNYVWLAPWFLSNYYYRYTRPIDYLFYRKLRKPIAKSLFTILGNGWYASKGAPYIKNYRALCDEFLLSKHGHLSLIKQQLDPSHKELQKQGFLEKWEYIRAKGGDYNIVYYPGKKFFDGQEVQQERRQLADKIESERAQGTLFDMTLPDYQQQLLWRILDTCKDAKNEPLYRKIVTGYPKGLIEIALGETKQAEQEGKIRKRKGAFFLDVLKRLYSYQQRDGF